jgi:hypothetical protein
VTSPKPNPFQTDAKEIDASAVAGSPKPVPRPRVESHTLEVYVEQTSKGLKNPLPEETDHHPGENELAEKQKTGTFPFRNGLPPNPALQEGERIRATMFRQ